MSTHATLRLWLAASLALAACGGAISSAGGPDASSPGGSDASSPGGSDASSETTLPPLPDHCPSSCDAAKPVPPTVSSNAGRGNITMYSTDPSGGGACNYGSTSVMDYAAMSVDVQPGDGNGQWQRGRVCGQCLEVAALTSQGSKSVVVRVMDACPDANCGIDLGGAAPAAIMLDGFGRYDGAWRFVTCDGHPEVSDGPPRLWVKDGSNPWWAMVQVRNPPWPVASIGWERVGASATGELTYAPDTAENYFQVPQDLLQSDASYVLTVRYADGSSATVQLTSAQLCAESTGYDLQ